MGIWRTSRVLAGGVSVVLMLGFGPASSVSADSVTDKKKALDKQISQLKGDLEGTSADLVAAAVTLARAQADLVDARAREAAAAAALVEARKRDAGLAARLALAVAVAEKTARDMDSRVEQERATRAMLGRLARETYVTSGLTGLSIALQADSPDQFADRMAVAGTVLREQNSAIARLQEMQAETRARQSRLQAAQDQVAELKRLSALEVARRKQIEDEAAAAAAQVAGLVAQQRTAVAVISAKKAAEQARVEALQKEQDRLSAILAERARLAERKRRKKGGGGVVNPDPPTGGGILLRPAAGPLTSPYGMRFHPILRIWRLHAGQDLGVPCGTPVHAAASGTVISAGSRGGYGIQIVIDHGWMSAAGADLATTYNHLSAVRVRSGRVARGEVIGYSGNTGLSTGCHLHFSVLRNGAFVNPIGYL